MNRFKFEPLLVSGANYMRWSSDCEIRLKSKDLFGTLDKNNPTTEQQKNQALIIIRTHLSDDLQNQYMNIIDPADLWQALKSRYNRQAEIILPEARDEWTNLRFQDFKSVSEYNSAMYLIVNKLRMCGETKTDYEMMEKTFTTFHPSQTILQQQYRERNHQKYDDLIGTLDIAEKHNMLLLKNSERRPVGVQPFPEVNVHYNENPGRGRGRGYRGRNHSRGSGNRNNYGNGRGNGRGNDRGSGSGQGRGRNSSRNYGHPYNNSNVPQKRNVYNASSSKGKEIQEQPKFNRGPCYRCGSPTCYSRTCRAPKHVVEAYQKLKREQEKEKNKEANMVDVFGDDDIGPVDISNLETADFFDDPNERIDHLIGDGNVNYK